MSEDTPDILPEVRTVSQYLSDISPLLKEGDIRVILDDRGLSPDMPLWDLSQREKDLAKAEAYYKLCDLPVGGATNKEVDGSWSHTEGGWTVSSENIKQWRQKYIDLREKWGEEVLTKSTIRVHARGMRVWHRR